MFPGAMSRSRIVALDSLGQFTAVNLLSDPGAIGGKVVIPNCVQVHLIWALPGGKTGRNVLHTSVSPAFTPTTAIADAIRASLVTSIGARGLNTYLNTGAGIIRVDLRDIRAPDTAFVTGTSVAGTGASTGTQLPNEVAIVLTERTGKAGPGFRGRIYTCGWASNAVASGNLVDPTLVTNLTNFGTDLMATLAGQSMPLQIGQKARQAYTSGNTQHPARPAGLVPVTQVVCRNNTWDTQRRRGFK